MALLKSDDILDTRYRIIRHLGGGGFGQTYVAEDTKLPGKPQCIVKQLKPASNDPYTLQTARRLFDSEAQVLHKLGIHDQIPRLLAHIEENQEFYLVQEFIVGHSLSSELTPGTKFSETDAIALLQSILEPLAFVHQQDVIHRDIKPANLIRRQSDQKVVLIDFGAVKQIGTQFVNQQGQTRLTVAIGTPGYMPSEQSRGNPKLSSDVYAVGVIGIQALTGLMPDQLPEDSETAEIIWRDQVQVSSRLADILDQMVRYDFRQRYPSAAKALQALQQLNNPVNLPDTIPINPPPPPTPLPPTDIQKNTQKKGVLVPSLIGGSVLIAVVAAFAINQNQNNKITPSPVNQSVPVTSSNSPPASSSPTTKATTQTSEAISTPSPTTTSTQAITNNSSQASPELMIFDYYSDINQRNYQAAWRKQSPKLQSNRDINPRGYTDYLKFWSTVDKVDVHQVQTLNETPKTATVDVQLTYNYNNSNPDNYYHWRYYLVWDNNERTWLLDNRERFN